MAQTSHSRVYLAESPDGRRVALKELQFALVPGVEELDAFEREVHALQLLSHPSLPEFLGHFSEGEGVRKRLYIAQGFVEGESLAARLVRARLTEAEARDVAVQVLETLSYLHGLRPALLHRDIKPANLIWQASGRVVLVDFGAARGLATDVTHRSTLVGTFGYAPPEQLGGTVTASSDLYALGATLVHALSGKAPADLLDEGMAIGFERHVDVSEPFLAFLRRLLAPRRSERVASARDALALLESPLQPRAAPRTARASRWAVLVAGFVFAAAVASGAWMMGLSRVPPPARTEAAPSTYPPVGATPPADPAGTTDHRHFRKNWP